MSHAEFANWQQQKCKDIVAYHYNHTPSYRALVGSKLPDEWSKLPVLTKQHLQKPLEQLISSDYKLKDLYISNTSGSTGVPFYYAKDKFAHGMTWATILNLYESVGIKSTDLQARFYGIPRKGKSMLIEQAKDYAMNRVRFPVFRLGSTALANYLAQFRKRKFGFIYGYTNAIRHFCVFVKEKGIILKDICPTLKTVIVTSEMCTEPDRKFIESVTGVPVHIEYGSSEIGLIAFSDTEGSLKVRGETLFLETNEEREILVTTFFNKGFPLIRYKIGDLGVLSGSGSEMYISSLIGRSDDLVKLPNGNEAAGMTFYYCTRAILEKTVNIREIYYTQKSLSTFEINYVAEQELSDKDRKTITDIINMMLQPGLDLIFERKDEIRRKSNGKFQVFTSELTQK